jgi:hypothetical protein
MENNNKKEKLLLLLLPQPQGSGKLLISPAGATTALSIFYIFILSIN